MALCTGSCPSAVAAALDSGDVSPLSLVFVAADCPRAGRPAQFLAVCRSGHWFRLLSDSHEQFCWTSRWCRVMLLRRVTSSSGGDDDALDPHTMPLLSWEERRGQRTYTMQCGAPRPLYHCASCAIAPFLTVCSAYNLVEAWRLSSLWQGSSPAKTRASSRSARAHGDRLRPATHCEKWSEVPTCWHVASPLASLPWHRSDRRHAPVPYRSA